MDLLRQMDILNEETLDTRINIIGLGGIGSFLALLLAKMGFRRLVLMDHDIVEEHNIPNQIYRPKDVGIAKADALSEIIYESTGIKAEGRIMRVERERLTGIVVCAVDSMKDRKDIWVNSVRFKASVPLYIESRMGGEVMRTYTIRPIDIGDVRFYEKTLYSDQDSFNLPCTARAIAYTGFAIASIVGNQIKKFLMGEDLQREIIFDLKTLTLTIN